EDAREIGGGVEVGRGRRPVAEVARTDRVVSLALRRPGRAHGMDELGADDRRPGDAAYPAVAEVTRHLAADQHVAAVADQLADDLARRGAAPQRDTHLAQRRGHP